MAKTETREELEKRMDELAREYADMNDEQVKAEIEELNLPLATLNETLH